MVSIIIPFYNENEGIVNLKNKIDDYYEIRKFDFEIILINDGSEDQSEDLLLNLDTFNYPCKLIRLSKNFGAHAAVAAGFCNTNGNFITILPADLQISFLSIEKLYKFALENNNIVFGIRDSKLNGFFENIFSKMYAYLMRKNVDKDYPLSGIETVLISDKVRRHFINNIESNSSVYLQILSMGFDKKFLIIEKEKREKGKSKWTLSKKIKLLIDSFIAFSYSPIRFVTIIGITLFISGIGFSFYLFIRKILYNDLVSGWTMLISILTIGFGITNISLGIIAEYLWRTFDSSRKRPVFIIDDIIELKN